MLELNDIHAYVALALQGVESGQPLADVDAALVGLAVRASPSALDRDGIREYATIALDRGASPEQVHETLMIVSGLGVHTLMVGSNALAGVLRERGDMAIDAPLDEQRKRLWGAHVGDNPFWGRMEQELPGFLDSLLRQSPEAFEAFFEYCAVPWRTGAVRPVVKELISLATDATPTHRFMPGLKLHLANAIKLGAGRAEIMQTLAIAMSAPGHMGIR